MAGRGGACGNGQGVAEEGRRVIRGWGGGCGGMKRAGGDEKKRGRGGGLLGLWGAAPEWRRGSPRQMKPIRHGGRRRGEGGKGC